MLLVPLYWEITRWAVSGCCWFPFTGRLLGGLLVDVAGSPLLGDY